MPERSFGRTVRYRRTKLGLSQAKLGDLVGRSPSTIRSWERDRSAPTEKSVLHALAAILGVDEKSLFEKAGQDPPPEVESSPTVEQALATLHPEREIDSREDASSDDDESDEHEGDVTSEDSIQAPSDSGRESDPAFAQSPAPQAGYVKPPEPYVILPSTPPIAEPSYMEDTSQQQLYRVRNLATLVLVVALVIALIWALSETLGAISDWWDSFFGSLRL